MSNEYLLITYYPHSALHFVIHQDYQYRANNGQIAMPALGYAGSITTRQN
jgi:hypothetical protein